MLLVSLCVSIGVLAAVAFLSLRTDGRGEGTGGVGTVTDIELSEAGIDDKSVWTPRERVRSIRGRCDRGRSSTLPPCAAALGSISTVT